MRLVHHRLGQGEPLVLLHGIGSRWQVWEPVLDRLAQEREVVALDLPGFGASPPPPPGTPPGVDPLTELVGDFVAELGFERPHVAGNSLGGRLALELAKAGRARSATGLSPAGFHTPAEAVYQYATLWSSVHVARLLAPRAERLLTGGPLTRAAFAQMAARPGKIPPAEVAASVKALAEAPWFDETLRAVHREPFTGGEQIKVPVLIAWGQRDRLLLPRQARRAATAIPTARVITLRGCGHVPTYDDPEQVAKVLLEGSAVTRD